MFDHLDDPEPFRPDDAFRTGVVRRGRRLRLRRRLAAGGSAAVVLLVVGAVGAVAYLDRRAGSIDRVEVAGLTAAPPEGEPSTLLFVGVDTRPPGDPGGTGTRSDTIVLARVDPGADTLTILPIPRDLYVEVDGQPSRINQAVDRGGAGLLVRTIEDELGIEVNHYVQADLEGAVAVGDALGGLDLAFAAPLRDASTGVDLAAGCSHLDGGQLLALARSRHLQARVDGAWRNDPRSDLGRIERQQDIAAALLASFAGLDAGDPLELLRTFDAAVDHLTLDADTTADQLRDLVRGMAGAEVTQLRLPVADQVTPEGADVLVPGPDGDAVLADFAAGRPADHATSQVAPGPFDAAPC